MSLNVSLNAADRGSLLRKSYGTKKNGDQPASGDSGKPHPAPILVEEKGHLTQTMNRKVDFQVDPDSHELIVQVINSQTGEIVRQIPRDDFSPVKNRPAPSPGNILNEFA